MGAQGTAIVDFGAFPGKSDACVTVTGQTGLVAATSLAEAWLFGSTADHSEDEHMVEPLRVHVKSLVDNTGFTICLRNDNQITPTEVRPPIKAKGELGVGTRIYGQWRVAWVWN